MVLNCGLRIIIGFNFAQSPFMLWHLWPYLIYCHVFLLSLKNCPQVSAMQQLIKLFKEY